MNNNTQAANHHHSSTSFSDPTNIGPFREANSYAWVKKFYQHNPLMDKGTSMGGFPVREPPLPKQYSKLISSPSFSWSLETMKTQGRKGSFASRRSSKLELSNNSVSCDTLNIIGKRETQIGVTFNVDAFQSFLCPPEDRSLSRKPASFVSKGNNYDRVLTSVRA